MKNTTTAQSMRAALGYFILTDVWAHVQGHAEAVAIVERLKRQLMLVFVGMECSGVIVPGRRIGKRWRFSNQTDSGQSETRATDRARSDGTFRVWSIREPSKGSIGTWMP